jgi:Flp pilus assembly protein TadG
MLSAVWARGRALASDRHGAAAVVFTFCLVPMVIMGGVAVDYGRAQLLKTHLRAAADAAALAAAGAVLVTNDQRITLGRNVFKGNIPAKLGTIEPNVTIADGLVSVTANASSHASLLKIAGIDNIDISVVSRSAVPLPMHEIVMVLDYSSSMTATAGGGLEKWQAMRNAAVDLINRLKNGQAAPDLKIGLVPFADAVYLSLPGEYVLGGTAGTTWTNCTRDRKHPYVSEDTTPVAGNAATKWGRTDGNDTIGAGEYSDCPNYPSRNLVVRPMTNDHAGVISQLQSMEPHQGTNISIGMSIGWHVISPNAPFSEGQAYFSIGKTIILLTDGEQTTDSFGPGGAYNETSGEQNLVDMCAAIKAKGVRIITVAFDLDDSATRNRLQNCASTGYFYYEPTNGEQLAAAFQDMSTRLGGRPVLVE